MKAVRLVALASILKVISTEALGSFVREMTVSNPLFCVKVLMNLRMLRDLHRRDLAIAWNGFS